MTNDCAVSVRGDSPIYRILLLAILLTAIVPFASCATVDVTTHLDKTNATPFSIWAAMAIAGPVLLLWTVRTRLAPAELEADFVMSVAAWIPITFTAYSSWAVDRVVSSFMLAGVIYENHVIYNFTIFGIGYAILLLVAVLNTVRIIILHNKLQATTKSGRGYPQ